MDRGYLVETGTELASRAIGIWTLRFAFGRGAGPPEFPTTRFAVAVGTPDETIVPSLGDTDDRPEVTDDLSANLAVNSDETSRFRDNFDVWSLPIRARTDGGFRARDFGFDVAADNISSSS
jgi:hypothetical protein